MQDTELYRHLLGLLAPWTVARVELKVKEQTVDVWAEHGEGLKWPCPECATSLPLYDHAEERVWRHLDSCQFMTHLHARIPRVDCPEHGVRQVSVTWAEPRARFTSLFERLAIDVLKETDVLGATRILRISWDEAFHIMKRAVKRGLLRKARRVVRRIGVDEKAFAKGHDYLTLVCDLDGGTIEYIADDRKQESLQDYFRGLTPDQLEGIQAVAMDMWRPYIAAVREGLPNAKDKVVFDKFHIMEKVGEAVDAVRKREHREHRKAGSEVLTGSKYLWLYGRENLPTVHRQRFAELKALNLKTGRAWAIKESLRELWNYRHPTWAMTYWKRWYAWAIRSALEPIKKEARMVRDHLQGVMTYFRHRITNATSEGLNSKIQTVKKRAYGFRNRENFKLAIFFHCGGLALHP